MHTLSDERTEFLIKDRLSFMRFLGLGLACQSALKIDPRLGSIFHAGSHSNRVFDTYDNIIDAACNAWNRLVAQPQTITSIATVGSCQSVMEAVGISCGKFRFFAALALASNCMRLNRSYLGASSALSGVVARSGNSDRPAAPPNRGVGTGFRSLQNEFPKYTEDRTSH